LCGEYSLQTNNNGVVKNMRQLEDEKEKKEERWVLLDRYTKRTNRRK